MTFHIVFVVSETSGIAHRCVWVWVAGGGGGGRGALLATCHRCLAAQYVSFENHLGSHTGVCTCVRGPEKNGEGKTDRKEKNKFEWKVRIERKSVNERAGATRREIESERGKEMRQRRKRERTERESETARERKKEKTETEIERKHTGFPSLRWTCLLSTRNLHATQATLSFQPRASRRMSRQSSPTMSTYD